MKINTTKLGMFVLLVLLIVSMFPLYIAGAKLPQTNLKEEKVIIWAFPATPFGEENSPQQITSLSGSRYASSIYNGLMRRTYKNEWAFVHDLAADMPIVSEDGRNWTFTLREDLKFSDGAELNASSVVFSYRVHLTKSIDVAYSSLSPYFTNTSIYEIDNLTIQFNMTKPYAFAASLFSQWIYSEDHFGPQFEACLADVTLAACDWNTDHTGGNLRGGSGPFLKESYSDPLNFISLVPNPNYYMADQIKIERLIFRTIGNKTSAQAALAAGEINLFDSQYRAKHDELYNISGLTEHIVYTPHVQELIVNHLHPYFGLGNYSTVVRDERNNITGMEYLKNGNLTSARNIRKAMSHMIDGSIITWEIMGGLAIPSATIMPTDTIGFNETILPNTYNITVAQSFMEEAGFDFTGKTYDSATGAMTVPFFEISLLSPTGNPEIEQWATVIAQEFPKIGISVKGHETGEFSTVVNPRTFDYPSPPPIYDNGGYDVFISTNRFGLDWDPSGLYGIEAQNPNCCNVYNYNNATVEEAIADYLAELDPEKRIPLGNRLQELLYEDLPSLSIVQEHDHWGWDDSIVGLDGLEASLGFVEWEHVAIAISGPPSPIGTIGYTTTAPLMTSITATTENQNRGNPSLFIMVFGAMGIIVVSVMTLKRNNKEAIIPRSNNNPNLLNKKPPCRGCGLSINNEDIFCTECGVKL